MNALSHAILEDGHTPTTATITLLGIGQWVEAIQGNIRFRDRPLRVVAHDLDGWTVTAETMDGHQRIDLSFAPVRGFAVLGPYCAAEGIGEGARAGLPVGQRFVERQGGRGEFLGYAYSGCPGSGEPYTGPVITVGVI